MRRFSNLLVPRRLTMSGHVLKNYARFLVIESNDTPNPECLRFFSMELSFLPPGLTLDFPNEGHSYKSPLATVLFSIDGVKAVYFADEYLTVTKIETEDWIKLTPLVSEAISSFAGTNQNILSEDIQSELLTSSNKDTEPGPQDTEVVLAVKELIATRIRPMVRGDGGNVRYIGMEEDGSVYVLLEGACKSCPSSGATLKNGIERMLMHWIPEVTEVMEVDEDFAFDFVRKEKEKSAPIK